jgi:hypothetical protein
VTALTISMHAIHALLAAAGAAGVITSANGLTNVIEIARAIRLSMARAGGRP